MSYESWYSVSPCVHFNCFDKTTPFLQGEKVGVSHSSHNLKMTAVYVFVCFVYNTLMTFLAIFLSNTDWEEINSD